MVRRFLVVSTCARGGSWLVFIKCSWRGGPGSGYAVSVEILKRVWSGLALQVYS